MNSMGAFSSLNRRLQSLLLLPSVFATIASTSINHDVGCDIEAQQEIMSDEYPVTSYRCGRFAAAGTSQLRLSNRYPH